MASSWVSEVTTQGLRMLAPGKRQRLQFQSGRLTSRQLQAGSRLVVVLGVIK
jgi:hypothetical protein